jgi:hypothetical protein
MEDRTDIIETPERRTEVVVPPTQTTEVVNANVRPMSGVDHLEAVAYDPYENRRAAALRWQQVIYWVFGLIEGLILIRFVLKALGANPSAGFAEFIYGITGVLVAPFVGLFGNQQAQGNILELNSLVALVVYALVAWLLARLAWIMVGDHRTAVTTRSTSVDSRS